MRDRILVIMVLAVMVSATMASMSSNVGRKKEKLLHHE
jgi:hypothetical protein